MVTVTVPDSRPPRLSVDGVTEYDTPPEPLVTATDTVREEFARLLTVTANDRLCPEAEGTAPKLTLTGSSATVAPTAFSRFSRPAPMTFTSLTGAPVWKLLRTFSAVLTTAERTSAADQPGC